MRQGCSLEKGYTRNELLMKRRHDMLEYNMRTFGKTANGIHKEEQPKFSQRPSTQQYWRINSSYIEKPPFQSQQEMLHSRMPWAKYCACKCRNAMDVKSAFKTVYVSQTKNKQVTQKINNAKCFTYEETDHMHKTKKKWVERMFQFMPWRLNKAEDYNEASHIEQNTQPMFSSFAANKQFAEPSVKAKKMY
eukprot:TRINITY_DN15221_c0_g3_i1.p1 TRINITY_DN15221_c0_g3~~TRINITY_DN15221_c0_g3_i1.p1  ORF type:complete len:191 (+),score=38.40 TRINITY_DN15221_c0_g3_i1:1131-1703(+)